MEELKKMLEKAEELGWSYDIIEEDDRRYVELGKYSPAGEDFHMDIDIGKKFRRQISWITWLTMDLTRMNMRKCI